jgi:hypothetical protein
MGANSAEPIVASTQSTKPTTKCRKTMEAPFKLHLWQNTCPTDDEMLDIRAAIKANSRSAQAIDEEIAHILDSVSNLIKKRDAHIDAEKSYSTLLQPIRRTPDDILSLIFQACIPQDRLTMTRTHPAVLISHVCRRWRQLSLSTPQLWSGIHLLLPEHPVRRQPRDLRADFVSLKAMDKAIACWDARVDQIFAIAKIWVTRSMEYPIDVTLSACRAPSSFDDISKASIKELKKAYCSFVEWPIGGGASGLTFSLVTPEGTRSSS